MKNRNKLSSPTKFQKLQSHTILEFFALFSSMNFIVYILFSESKIGKGSNGKSLRNSMEQNILSFFF
jgi:hypothetical protein